MDLILQDIIHLEPLNVSEYNRPYQFNDEPRTKMRILQRNYRRMKTARNRIGMLTYLYFAGELLDSFEDIDYKRAKLVLSAYQKEVSEKLFMLFNEIGLIQLLRTKTLTTWQVQRINKTKIQDLISRAKSFLTTTFENQVGGGLSTNELDLTIVDEITWDLSSDLNQETINDQPTAP